MSCAAYPKEIEEEEEAKRIARIAERAEAKARAKTQSSKPKSLEQMANMRKKEAAAAEKVVFLTKAQRQALALERLAEKRKAIQDQREDAKKKRTEFYEKRPPVERTHKREKRREKRVDTEEDKKNKLLEEIKDQYLGKKIKKKKVVKASEKFAKVYRFDWEASEDTSTELNPLYANRMNSNLLFGRGYIAGTDMRQQRQSNTFLSQLTHKRQSEQEKLDRMNSALTKEEMASRQQQRLDEMKRIEQYESQRVEELRSREAKTMGVHWSEKKLAEMVERDWRIFREDFDITVGGGRAPHPLRNWEEGYLPQPVMQAIIEMKFVRPSPIQMQGIPIGLQGRDIIGIAETGSGKTAAFIIPMISYIYRLPQEQINDTSEQGPVALVMAPTRELALQIEKEAAKLVKYTKVGQDAHAIKTLSVVGGQSIEDQAFKLREGIEIVIGTPGRLKDCLENRYLVLNQCNYVVLDEADRMIDMGFEPQVIAVLESMGGLLKSENEDELEQQLQTSTGLKSKYRVTTMFSATMPAEVERLAKTYLRHPVVVRIGDEDSGKNKRIDQQVLYLRPEKKQSQVVKVLREIVTKKETKVIVFVNLKKQCDSVARTISQERMYPTVLHGGKTQEQREYSLEGFRTGEFDVLVATDVAGRGLDIPDVTHVINYDLPSKIENYSHRIGRTGRAGKEGVAISFLTEDDTEIMYDLKNYLQSTNMPIPPELASNPAAKNAPGARDERGKLLTKSKRDTVIYTN